MLNCKLKRKGMRVEGTETRQPATLFSCALGSLLARGRLFQAVRYFLTIVSGLQVLFKTTLHASTNRVELLCTYNATRLLERSRPGRGLARRVRVGFGSVR